MNETATKAPTVAIRNLGDLFRFLGRELKPKGKILTPFNVISLPIMLLGAVLIVLRFAKGLGSVTNLSQEFPWGLWIGFDVLIGVVFAGVAYILCFVLYILRAERYHTIIRVTVLNGFLAYVFYSASLVLDLGRPWNAFNFIIGNKFGVSSVLFLVAWHFLLYTVALFVEFSPAVAEWLGLKRVRKTLGGLTLAAVIFGVMLSTGHQAGIGGLFLLAKAKLHPLWYSEFIAMLFVLSSVFAGLSMVIFEGIISHRVFRGQLDHAHHDSYNNVLVGLARICSGSMLVYVFMKILDLIHSHSWSYLGSGWGSWYLFEVIGLVLVPAFLFAMGARSRNFGLIKGAALLTMAGIFVNRLNVCIIAYKWYVPFSERYIPSWMEVAVTVTVVLAEIWAIRWIINRMPILRESPEWARE